jgi:hypothetical protein
MLSKASNQHGPKSQKALRKRRAKTPVCATCPQPPKWAEGEEEEDTQEGEMLLLGLPPPLSMLEAGEATMGTQDTSAQEDGGQGYTMGSKKEEVEEGLELGTSWKTSSRSSEELESSKETEKKTQSRVENASEMERKAKIVEPNGRRLRGAVDDILRQADDKVLEETAEMREHCAWGMGQTFSQTRSEALIDWVGNNSFQDGGPFVNISISHDAISDFSELQDEDEASCFDWAMFFNNNSTWNTTFPPHLEDNASEFTNSQNKETENLALEWTSVLNGIDTCHEISPPDSETDVPNLDNYEPTIVEQLLSQPVPDTLLLDDQFLDWIGSAYLQLTCVEEEDESKVDEEKYWDWVVVTI